MWHVLLAMVAFAIPVLLLAEPHEPQKGRAKISQASDKLDLWSAKIKAWPSPCPPNAKKPRVRIITVSVFEDSEVAELRELLSTTTEARLVNQKQFPSDGAFANTKSANSLSATSPFHAPLSLFFASLELRANLKLPDTNRRVSDEHINSCLKLVIEGTEGSRAWKLAAEKAPAAVRDYIQALLKSEKTSEVTLPKDRVALEKTLADLLERLLAEVDRAPDVKAGWLPDSALWRAYFTAFLETGKSDEKQEPIDVLFNLYPKMQTLREALAAREVTTDFCRNPRDVTIVVPSEQKELLTYLKDKIGPHSELTVTSLAGAKDRFEKREEKRLANLFQQLGDDSWPLREAAVHALSREKKLLDHPLYEKFRKSEDPEIRSRVALVAKMQETRSRTLSVEFSIRALEGAARKTPAYREGNANAQTFWHALNDSEKQDLERAMESVKGATDKKPPTAKQFRSLEDSILFGLKKLGSAKTLESIADKGTLVFELIPELGVVNKQKGQPMIVSFRLNPPHAGELVFLPVAVSQDGKYRATSFVPTEKNVPLDAYTNLSYQDAIPFHLRAHCHIDWMHTVPLVRKTGLENEVKNIAVRSSNGDRNISPLTWLPDAELKQPD